MKKLNKAEQSAKVDADKEAGEKAIDGAKDADGINQALNDGKAKIDSDHVPGKSVADQKETAKANLDGEATKVKGEIDADNTLTSAEKAQQKNNVDSVKATDQAKIDAATNADDINAAYDQGVKDIDAQHVPGKSVADQKEAAKANLDGEATKVKNDIANDDTLTKDEKAEQSAKVDADKEAGEKAIDGAKDADGINQALNDGKAKIDSDHVPGKSVADQKETAKANLDGEATKVKGEIDADNTLTSAEKAQQKNNVDSVKATDQAKIDAATNADDINAAYDQGVKDIDAQHVKKRINAGKPKKKFTPRRIYMVKGFYRYSSTSFSKKNRLQGYKQHKRPNAVMFTIVGETKSKHGLKRYEVYQIVSKKEGLFRVDHKKWGYITAKPSYMRPLYYSKNVHKVRVIGKGLRVYKDIKLSKYVKSYKRGTVLKVKAVKRLGTTYRLQLSDGRYVSANKNLVRVENTPRRVYMVKGFYRYSSTSFSKKNRLQGYKQHKRPNAVMFTIVGETKSKHGLKRYEVYQIVSKKEGLFRVDHKKWGYITAKPSYMRPLYYSKNVHKVRVIGKGLRVYKDIKLSKYVKSYKRGTVLKVKAVKRLGTTYRLQLSDGRYVGANKNLVKIFKPSK
ncbi:DUF5776 domain-containing protein [Apilactobacillus kunkeei]|uniref:DUF5776 domain-containing protein n=1 Tax=Apilactobacillus kunkeei TaxID=148814 RepID=UPI0039DFD7BC